MRESYVQAGENGVLQNYKELEKVLVSWGAVEASAMEVYSDIFHLGEGLIQRSGEGRNTKSNPLGYWKQENSEKGHYRILFEDSFEETLKELQSADFAIMNGISYFGRKNTQSAANRMFAMIFDLDGVTGKTLNTFLYSAMNGADFSIYPVPNYVALSGHGVHLYYIFEQPIPLYPNIKLQLKEFKYAVTDKIWNRYTSTLDSQQFQGINQGFRVIGGRTKIEGIRVRAFKLNTHPFTLSQIGEFIPGEKRIDESKLWRESKVSLSEAKKMYPEWYAAVVERGEKKTGRWTCKRDLYDWWKRQIQIGTTHHHRYFCIMCLAIYAAKSGIEFEELERDALHFVPFMNMIVPDDPFTESDVRSALECFDERYCRFPIDDIAKVTGISIRKNKRNHQNQKDHLEEARMIRDIRMKRAGRKWTDGNGRPLGSGTKEVLVREWMANHPEGSVTECARDLGISRPTVYKYWR